MWIGSLLLNGIDTLITKVKMTLKFLGGFLPLAKKMISSKIKGILLNEKWLFKILPKINSDKLMEVQG